MIIVRNCRKFFKSLFGSLWKDESGATAVEYALIAGLVAAIVVAGVTIFGDTFKKLFTGISDKLEGVTENLDESSDD